MLGFFFGQWIDGEGFEHFEIATVENDNLNLQDNTWYHLKVMILNNSISAYIDDVLYASANSLPYSSGRIGLAWDNDQPALTAFFDNVRVTVPEPVTALMLLILLRRLFDKESLADNEETLTELAIETLAVALRICLVLHRS